MQKIQAPDRFKIPAFQRKRSLSAKARRVRKPATAFERREAGVPVRRRRVSESEVGESFSSPLLDDLSAGGGLRASEEELPVFSRATIREMRRCGVAEDFFDKISVVAVRVTSSIRIGDRLVFETEDGLFEQVIDSMQINREDVVTAYNGDDLGIKVLARPKKNGSVYKVV
ncbi:MAG: hypothetical protein WC604_04455 [Candidatus Gracilibacteria bacterium]